VTGIAWIGLEQNIIDTAVSEWRKCLLACVRTVGQHWMVIWWQAVSGIFIPKIIRIWLL